MSDLPLTVAEARAILYVDENVVGFKPPDQQSEGLYAAWQSIVVSAKKRVASWERGGAPPRCEACTIDPDPRGWSACFSCRRLNGW